MSVSQLVPNNPPLDFSDMGARATSTQNRYPCSRCSRVFRRPEHERRHERTRQLSQLPACLRSANRPADTKEKPFACYCGIPFARKDALKRHKQVVHKDCSDKSPDCKSKRGYQKPRVNNMFSSVAESLSADPWEYSPQQPLGSNGTDQRLDVPSDIHDQLYQQEFFENGK